MIQDTCGLVAAGLNFAGGVILTFDALTIRARTRASGGAKRLRDILQKRGRADVLTGGGKTLDSDTAIELWLAVRSLEWTRVGFALMTAGFLVEAAKHF
jgi:hypothetical protein